MTTAEKILRDGLERIATSPISHVGIAEYARGIIETADKWNPTLDTDALRERDEARAMVGVLLTIVKNEEWTPWDGTAEPVWCRSCHGIPSKGHAPNCGKALAIAKAEAHHV
jgi:hypothetical protein